MENERLLSDAEIMLVMWDFAQSVSEEALDKLQQIDRFKMIAAAQDRKTTAARDKWWVTEIDKHLKQFQGYEYIDNEWWQSLKQSLEVKE